LAQTLKKKHVILTLAVIAVLASVSLVAADEAGIFTLNIFNSPNSQLTTNISNSSITAQTNYTNSQAAENITLTNSTLTLNVNGQNITITDQNGDVTVQTPVPTWSPPAIPTPTPTLSPPTPVPTASPLPPATQVKVAFIGSGPSHSPIGNGTQYDFNVTLNVPTSFNYPFGKNVSHTVLGQALIPIASKFMLVTSNSSGFQTAAWQNTVVVDGENTFSLWSTAPLTPYQTSDLTTDLQNMFQSIV
jgi:hypothetical protein